MSDFLSRMESELRNINEELLFVEDGERIMELLDDQRSIETAMLLYQQYNKPKLYQIETQPKGA